MNCIYQVLESLIFYDAGHIPSLKEGNSQETIFNPPWRHEPVAIGLCNCKCYSNGVPFLRYWWKFFIFYFNCISGSRFGEAFQEPASFLAIRPLFEVRPLWAPSIKKHIQKLLCAIIYVKYFLHFEFVLLVWLTFGILIIGWKIHGNI